MAAATSGPSHALWLSTIAFTVCFAVWTNFATIGVRINADRFGGRVVGTLTMLAAAAATCLLSFATTCLPMFVATLRVGVVATDIAAPRSP